MTECGLSVSIATGRYTSEVCDGCGKRYEADERYIDDIDSCCFDCVRHAALLVQEAESDG